MKLIVFKDKVSLPLLIYRLANMFDISRVSGLAPLISTLNH